MQFPARISRGSHLPRTRVHRDATSGDLNDITIWRALHDRLDENPCDDLDLAASSSTIHYRTTTGLFTRGVCRSGRHPIRTERDVYRYGGTTTCRLCHNEWCRRRHDEREAKR